VPVADVRLTSVSVSLNFGITEDDMLTYRQGMHLSLNVHIGQCEGSSQKRAYVKTDIPDDDSVRVETFCNLKVI
jgi:hypothetical protein